jgi:hypothetical protein
MGVNRCDRGMDAGWNCDRGTRSGNLARVLRPTVVACSTPLSVPITFTAWAVLCWFAGFRTLLRDPATGIRQIAEARSRSRLLHPFGGGDVDKEFKRQWRLRWLIWPVVIGYLLGTLAAWIAAIHC